MVNPDCCGGLVGEWMAQKQMWIDIQDLLLCPSPWVFLSAAFHGSTYSAEMQRIGYSFHLPSGKLRPAKMPRPQLCTALRALAVALLGCISGSFG
jgi:hypothetical protein